ncbi:PHYTOSULFOKINE-RELATED [Salix purpurea]|uniref:Phytosulfokine n=1 Tax=Salix purpurea TaxID=77065 RepID=A0A9Q0SX46_SALPP|nr:PHYTOSULFOKINE-RELATED [Salix purpurea]
MSYRIGTVCIIALLLSSFTLTCSARPEPALADATPVETLHGDNAEAETAEVEKSCEGVGEDECLMRRTLAAQVDYIYTQKHKP